MGYRADIDGLRAVAVLLVLVFHFDLFALGKAGFIGVDVFFVISGFLITTIIRDDLGAGRFRFGTFLYRRVRRLYPALLATLLLTLLAGWVLFLPHRYEELAAESLWTLLYVVNFYFWQNINYFGLQAGSVPLLHMWSLAVEEQFYLAFPLVCLLIWRWVPWLLLPAVVAGLLVSFALGLVFAPVMPEAAFYLLPTRAWELLLGAALALAVYGRGVSGGWLRVMGPLGLVLILASVVVWGPLTRVPGWFTLLPTLGAAALIAGGFDARAPVTRLMSVGPMVWIGKISYPLYLVHWPIRIFLQEHLEAFTPGWRWLGFLASFGVAAAIYYLVETPIRQGRVIPGKGRFLGLAAALSVAAAGVSGLVMHNEGVPARFPPEVVGFLAFREDTPAAFRHCESAEMVLEALCPLGDKGADREVLVIGDSHAWALSGALDLWLAGEGRGGALIFRHDCMPVLGAGQERCRQPVRAALELAETSPGVTEVVLVSIWRQALPEGGKPFDGRWVPEAEVAGVFARHLKETVERLQAAGKRVTIVEPLFAAERPVPETLATNLAFGRDRAVDTSLAEHRATFAPVFEAFDALGGVRRVSLIDDLCEGGICRAIVDGRPLFFDNNHLAFSHAARMAEVLRNGVRD